MGDTSAARLAYLVTGLFAGILTFTVTVTMLALGVGLLPAFLLGSPSRASRCSSCTGCAMMERRRVAAFLDVDLPGRPAAAAPDRGWVRRIFLRVRSGEFWKEVAHGVLLLPLGAVSASLVLAFWSAAVAGITLPLYADRLPGDDAVTWLDWSDALETWAGFAAGVAFLLLARLLSAGLVLGHVALSRSLLSPSSTEALRLQVTELRETRARVVDAADAERRRIERDLHDGAQQRLVALAMNLGRAQGEARPRPRRGAASSSTQAHQEAKDAIAELRDLVRGMHPAVLTDRGLDAALSALAARSPVPVQPRRRRARSGRRRPSRPSPTSSSPRR